MKPKSPRLKAAARERINASGVAAGVMTVNRNQKGGRLAIHARIQGIAQPFTEEIIAEYGDEDRHPRKDREPPSGAEGLLARDQQVAPRGRRRLHADTEK